MAKFKKHIIVAGSARSGTSWLAETIAVQHRYRLLFEPEHEFNTRRGNLICDKLFTSNNFPEEAQQYLKKVFLNRIDCDWIAQNSNRKFKRHLWPFIPKKIVIKFVRANLAVSQISERFQIPFIHLLRNPYEVIHSQQRVEFPWLYDLSHFIEQRELVELVKTEFNFDLENSINRSNIEKLGIRWCLENVIPLEVLPGSSGKSMTVNYEELRNDLGKFLELCDYFEFEPIHNLAEKYGKPSSKTHPNSELRNKNSNSKKLTKQELQDINRILDIFECKLYPRI